MTDVPDGMTDWTIGHSGIDQEHHLQIEMLTALADALRMEASADAIHEIADRLVEYSKLHFASEEMLMRLYAYEHLAAHESDHMRALDEMASLQKGLENGARGATAAHVHQLTRSVVGHIGGADRAFAEFLEGLRGGSDEQRPT